MKSWDILIPVAVCILAAAIRIIEVPQTLHRNMAVRTRMLYLDLVEFGTEETLASAQQLFQLTFSVPSIVLLGGRKLVRFSGILRYQRFAGSGEKRLSFSVLAEFDKKAGHLK